jgi:hypothetical protein
MLVRERAARRPQESPTKQTLPLRAAGGFADVLVNEDCIIRNKETGEQLAQNYVLLG